MLSKEIEKATGGRPPKFREASRRITVTLPERVLQSLERVGSDRARALVKCVEAAIGKGDLEQRPVELIEVLPGKALIVVNSNRSLSRIDWLRMIEIAPARYLLVVPPGMPIERLEVEVQDLMESTDSIEEAESLLLETLQKMLVKFRRNNNISTGELLLVNVS